MHFYFHLVGPSGAISDDTGLEALSLEVAEIESRQAIREILHEGMSGSEDWDGWQLEITDASRHVLLTIPLDQSQEAQATERSWLAAKNRISIVHSMLLAVGCGIDWQSVLAILN